MTDRLYPLLFAPVLKDYLWGGRGFAALGRELPAAGVVAESWEIAAHEDGTTAVINGDYAGRPLTAVLGELGLDLIGSRAAWALERGKFPLLVKLIDANQPLSVQVHPDDGYALSHEGNELGKTEMWVVLQARPGAELILGVHSGVTRQVLRAALEVGRPDDLLHRVPVRAGDHVCVPSGTLHAIMDGLLIAEIQQNSNTTYRVFDWNRTGPDGKPRTLHVDKALDVIDFERAEPGICAPQVLEAEAGIVRGLLCSNRYFVTERLELAPGKVVESACDGQSLEIWGALAGEATVNDVPLPAVRFCLLPAALGAYRVTARTQTTLLRTYLPPA